MIATLLTKSLLFIPKSVKNLFTDDWNDAGFKKYFFNTGWMFAGQFANLAISFVVGAYIARYLGPSDFGLLSYTLSFVGLFSFLVGFGVDGILNRELVANPDKRNQLIGSGLWMKLIGSLLAIFLVNTLVFFLQNDAFSRLLIFIFSLTFLFQGFGVLSIYFQSKVLAKRNVQAQMVTASISSALKIIGVIMGFTIVWFVTVFVIEAMTSALVLWLLYRASGENIDWKFRLPVIGFLFTDSWPLMFSTVTTVVYMKIDQTMLKYMLSDTAVGVYAAAVRLAEVWYFIPNIICASVFPAIVMASKTNKIIYKTRIVNLSLLMFVLAIVITIPSVVFAQLIVMFVFGEAYAAATVPFMIYSIASFPVFLMAVLAQYLIAENATRTLFIASLLGAITNVTLNVFLIPSYGTIGAAIATSISYTIPIITVITAMVLTRRLRGL